MDITKHTEALTKEILNLVAEARTKVATVINAELTLLYWNIGQRINMEVLNNERAVYGKEIIKTLATNLNTTHGSGWSEKQLRHCMPFATIFPDLEIVYAVSRQLTWTHFRALTTRVRLRKTISSKNIEIKGLLYAFGFKRFEIRWVF